MNTSLHSVPAGQCSNLLPAATVCSQDINAFFIDHGAVDIETDTVGRTPGCKSAR
jgi:hypothetical protein